MAFHLGSFVKVVSGPHKGVTGAVCKCRPKELTIRTDDGQDVGPLPKKECRLTGSGVANKFHCLKVRIDNHLFHSTLEGARYLELRAKEKGGLIHELECQKKFPYHDQNGKRLGYYYADFTYTENQSEVVEDVKGAETAIFKMKAALLAGQGTFIAIVKERQIDPSFRSLAKDIRNLQDGGVIYDWDTETDKPVSSKGAA